MPKLKLTVLALLLTGACDGKSAAGEGKAAQSKAPAKPSEAKSDVKSPGKADAKNPHAKPDAKNPHAGMAGGPHAGMAKPPAPKPKGPPRDIKPSGEVVQEAVKELQVSVPKEWEKGAAAGMRMAQWVLPGPGGDGEMVVFRFPGGAGGIEANIDRWKKQFQAPEGKSIDDLTKIKKSEVGELKITLVDISGRFVAAVRPGEDAKHDEANYRMLSAIIEGVGDPFFFKATGPAKTMDLWAEPYDKMLAAAKVKK